MNIYIIFIFLILFIFNINGAIINFNSTFINQCNKSTPCSLTSNEIWENQQLPKNGDDIMINFQLNNINILNDIYLYMDTIEIELSSFTLYGSLLNYSTYFNINNSNLTINKMYIDNSYLSIKNGLYNFNQFDIDSSSIIIDSSYIISNYTNLNNNNNNNNNNNISFINKSLFIVNDVCIFNIPVYHYSGILELSGQVYINETFESNGLFNYTGTSVGLFIQSDASFNQLEIYSNANIFNQIVTINGSLTVFDKTSEINLYNSTLNFSGLINGNYSLIGNQITINNNSTLNIQSGYSISIINPNSYGTINIIDSNKQTNISNNNPMNNLNINSISNLNLNGASLNTIIMTNQSSQLNVTKSSNIKALFNNGTTIVSPKGTLNIIGSSYSYSEYTNVFGTLEISTQYYDGKYIQVFPNGILSTFNSTLNTPISGIGNATIVNGLLENQISPSSKTLNKLSTYKSLALDTEGKFINKNNLTIQYNLFSNPNSIIEFSQVKLNNSQPYITVINGSVILDRVQFQIDFLTTNLSEIIYYPNINDTVLLIQAPLNATINNVTSIDVQLFNTELSNLQSGISQNNITGIISLTFTNKPKGGLSPKYIIGIALGSVGALIILIALIVFIFKKKKPNHHGEKQSLINH